jgi:DNA polymerase III delta prime subunit/predicted Ser/Thr protein kinase
LDAPAGKALDDLALDDAELDDAELGELETSLRQLRPPAPEATSLEQKLAIASILSASGLDGSPPNLGRLEVQSKIGGGAMGVVYRAWDPELERPVAVKLLRGWSEAEERAVIVGEARALAQLSHPNVVAVYDIVDEAGELCFVMEYVAGVTLRDWLDSHPEAPWREVLEWFIQAARGVVAAHGAEIVHQDLKPENILVGDDGRARVVDFGLARWNVEGVYEGLAGGTPQYMAPEVTAKTPATAKSDQFSFCLALREALASKGASDVVADAVERGVSEDPEARYASFDALVAVLEQALASPGDRPRSLLLKRVERLWLRGVLERSLAGGAVVDLSLRGEPTLVDSPWESWGVQSAPDATTSSHELKHILSESNGSLLMIGPPGSGKTTMLLVLCRELWRTASLQLDEPAPVVLSLSTYQPETRPGRSLSAHFARWIVDELVAKYGLPRPAVGRWFDASGIVLLLDGLDETDPQLRDKVVQTLNQFREDHPLSMVVTCRDSEYEALDRRLSFGGAARIQPLDDVGVTDLVEGRRANQLMAQLATDEHLRAQLRNPLLLTLYASGVGIEDDASDASDTSDTPVWGHAYERYVEHAFADTRSEPERHRLLGQLTFLARAMREHNTSDLWLERLHFGWLEHRWERIAAYAMGVLVVCVFGVGLNVAQVPITGNALASALTFGIGVSLSSFAYTRGRIKPVESLRWSWRRMLRLLPITTVCAAAVGIAEGLRVNLAANLVGAALTGAIMGIAFSLDSGDRAGKVRPNEGVRRSLRFALATSFGAGVPAGLLFGLVLDPYLRQPLIDVVEGTGNMSLMGGVSVGLFVFTAMFLIYGGFTVFMHYVLRLWIAWRTPLPVDLQRMLDRAVELGLMRRVGGGYVFLHRTLLDYFADRR